MTSILNKTQVYKKPHKRGRKSRFSRKTQSIKTTQVEKDIKEICIKEAKKDTNTTVDVSCTSLNVLKEPESRRLLEMLDSHFQDLQRDTQDRCKKELQEYAKKMIKLTSNSSIETILQCMQQELEYARSDSAFVLNQETTLQKALQRLSICLETYTKEAKLIQTQIQSLLLPDEAFELNDLWADADTLIEEADALSQEYLHKMKDSMQKCNEIDQENKRKLMNRLL
ncbi:hypothetical protein PNEG_02491 [Pneumocystis murina B123]|uniref:Uncharacterized protein n=1 Tax=Pneumocystis murina (strain B123) TaxID=1069680 RepID=M7NKH8_PNEMU|nr:hypothetical protein PNEG_02491 [Pneumocystis murina B123]EMR09148.1 hypothetical protein PNEG_02491 [Pneumocystis murina B123]